jgi:hypothetical protein
VGGERARRRTNTTHIPSLPSHSSTPTHSRPFSLLSLRLTQTPPHSHLPRAPPRLSGRTQGPEPSSPRRKRRRRRACSGPGPAGPRARERMRRRRGPGCPAAAAAAAVVSAWLSCCWHCWRGWRAGRHAPCRPCAGACLGRRQPWSLLLPPLPPPLLAPLPRATSLFRLLLATLPLLLLLLLQRAWRAEPWSLPRVPPPLFPHPQMLPLLLPLLLKAVLPSLPSPLPLPLLPLPCCWSCRCLHPAPRCCCSRGRWPAAAAGGAGRRNLREWGPKRR